MERKKREERSGERERERRGSERESDEESMREIEIDGGVRMRKE